MSLALRIGTRGSALARVQACGVQGELGEPSEVVIIRTTGDQRQDVRLDLVGGVGLFTKELERALLADEIDLAVHSLKDLPVEQPPGLILGAIPKRAPVSDLLLVRPEALDMDHEIPLRSGTTLGTSSSRRRALLANYRADVEPVNLRGNVPTRLRKCVEGECDSLILAQAGLLRLDIDLAPLVAFELSPSLWPCAPGQGALGLELRLDDLGTMARIEHLEHTGTRSCVEAERTLLQISGGGCHSAFGAWAQLRTDGAVIHMALSDALHGFRSRRFENQTLSRALDEAGAWLENGATPIRTAPRGPEDWLCRPASVCS